MTLLQSYTHFGPTDTMFDEQQCSPARRRILRQKESSMNPTLSTASFLYFHTLYQAPTSFMFYCVIFFLTHSVNAIDLAVFLFHFHSSLVFDKLTKSIFIQSLGLFTYKSISSSVGFEFLFYFFFQLDSIRQVRMKSSNSSQIRILIRRIHVKSNSNFLF